MSLWEDLEKFLSSRLEEFLKANPQLELLVLVEKVREEEDRAKRDLINLRREEKELYTKIFDTAQEIKKWYERKQKAQESGREDLAKAAQERETQLLTEGNQHWSRKTEVLAKIDKTETLIKDLVPRRLELEAKLREQQINQPPPQSSSRRQAANDDLESKFQQWEVDQALNDLKRKMGK